MSFAHDLAALFQRDLTRLIQELEAFGEEPAALWSRTGGIANPAGNLALHLEGNLREYVGRQLGGVAYQRKRDLEFTTTGLALSELVLRISEVRDLVPRVIASLQSETLDADFPENVLGVPLSTRQFLIHCLAHLNYHLGQADYARRVLTGHGAIPLAGL